MTPQEVIDQAQSFGVVLAAKDDRLVVDAPRGVITPSLRQALGVNKAAILCLLAHRAGVIHEKTSDWPPLDATELLRCWEALQRPEILLSPGLTITNLRTWLYPEWSQDRPPEHLSAVRRYLLESLPPCEVPTSDPLLEEWRRVSIPEWRRILAESTDRGDDRRAKYARWMLLEVLFDSPYPEPGR